jgi:hypothetical protein
MCGFDVRCMLLKVGAGGRVEGMTIVGYCWSIKEAATLLPVTDKQFL